MAQTYEIDIKRFNGQDYDTLLPTPADHATTHQANGSDPLTLQAGNYGTSTIPTDAYQNSSVTRAKLANDALYSPIVVLSAAETVLAPEHIGVTLRDNSNFPTNNITINANASIPVGAEFAVLFAFTSNVTITFGADTRAYHLDTSAATKFSVEKRGMVALKKFAASGGFDFWYISGNVEVAS